ncbi:hypothetical protein EST38_g12837 [Candolleomyces aberdarensis]|uniref:J domain-containing protein n=1 Tax=Candolleomyces aberdarensis TaxID=2316362 RepID=A0A4Q2D1E5_9AGAR|nr:hypothetical protein EST38_g12837 [Candolleomyces aberdarensis]
MGKKNAKKKAGNGNAAPARPSTSTAEEPSRSNSSPPSASPSPAQQPPDSPTSDDSGTQDAEKVKEQGNLAFKGGRYQEAVDLYTEAIELNGQEPSYWTNRAASYMSLKKFHPAISDCQQALFILGSSSTSPLASKTLLRMARCQYAVGSTTAALATLSRLLALEVTSDSPSSSSSSSSNYTQAVQLKQKILALDGHVKNFESAYKKRGWGMARLALDKCTQAVDAEGGECPAEWRVWKVELELVRGNWDAAGIAANEALRINANSPDALVLRGLVLFLGGKMATALQHIVRALQLDPGHERAQKLRKRVKEVERLKEEGNVAFKQNRLEEAVEKYGEALEKIGASEEEGKGGQIRATFLSNKATALFKLNENEKALEASDESLELSPRSFKALRTRARIYLNLEKYDAAIGDFKSRGESKTKDYYKILGVHKECTEIEIKKAYQRESLKHHPDKGGDEEQFKLVSEAYAILSIPRSGTATIWARTKTVSGTI